MSILEQPLPIPEVDRKSTRLNSSHGYISYAVFCLKKKTRPSDVTPVVNKTKQSSVRYRGRTDKTTIIDKLALTAQDIEYMRHILDTEDKSPIGSRYR